MCTLIKIANCHKQGHQAERHAASGTGHCRCPVGHGKRRSTSGTFACSRQQSVRWSAPPAPRRAARSLEYRSRAQSSALSSRSSPSCDSDRVECYTFDTGRLTVEFQNSLLPNGWAVVSDRYRIFIVRLCWRKDIEWENCLRRVTVARCAPRRIVSRRIRRHRAEKDGQIERGRERVREGGNRRA